MLFRLSTRNSPLIRIAQRKTRRLDRGHRYLRRAKWAEDAAHQVDYLYADDGDDWQTQDAFVRLRWGGMIVYASRSAEEVRWAAQQLREHGGFRVDLPPQTVRSAPLLLPMIGRRGYLVAARKVMLIPPGEYTDRFTFDVRLIRDEATGRDVVLKRVPSYKQIAERLHRKFPDASPETILDRTRKLVDRVLPVFLTREVGFLSLLQRDLPRELKSRVPKPLGVERSSDGLVRTMQMEWLRLGGKPLSQLEFARQASTLLAAVHDQVKIIHMDLRLDNMVITNEGVGFIDFGSAVRVDEDLSQSPLLSKLFDEMMSACQLQRMLGQMTQTGRVTSKLFISAHQKIDRAVDLFSLALYINGRRSLDACAGR